MGLMISKNFADQDWIGFNFIMIGLGLKNFTVRSFLLRTSTIMLYQTRG